MKNNVFLLYANCIPVKGHARTAVCDLQRHDVHFIPNGLYQLLEDDRIIRVDQLLDTLDEDDRITLTEYLAYLDQHEFGFYCKDSDIERFPKLSSEWIFPGHITNCILDAETELWYFNEALLTELDKLGCDYIQLRFFRQVTFTHLRQLLSMIEESKIKAVEILFPKSDSANFYNSAVALVEEYSQIQALLIHSDEVCETLRTSKNGMGQIITSTAIINSERHCGVSSPSYFAKNITHFTESQNFNSCLNRKISVSSSGDIKNCPSMVKSYGNITTSTLFAALDNPEFRKLWQITKNQVKTCRDCEFRYICTDCRAYLEEPDDGHSKPLKCGYDPYTCQWEDWSTHPMKQSAIKHYGL